LEDRLVSLRNEGVPKEELASLFERESAARADAEKANRLKDESSPRFLTNCVHH